MKSKNMFVSFALTLCVATLLGAQPNPYGQIPTNLPPLPSTTPQPVLPAPPVPPPFPIPTSTVQVNSIAQAQTALNNANCGTAVEFMPGTYLTGAMLTVSQQCPANSMLLIYGAGLSLASSSTNIGRTAALPTIQTSSNQAAFWINNMASGIYIAGLNFGVAPTAVGVYPIAGMCDEICTTLSEIPTNIWFDRVQVTAPTPSSPYQMMAQRGLELNCTNCGVINSAVWNIVAGGWDTQAILVDNTPGPVLIWNNDLEASGENIMFNTMWAQSGYTGTGLSVATAPSGVITGNLLSKQFAWESGWLGCVAGVNCPDVKDLLEFKMVNGVLVDHNVFENTFASDQAEATIVNCFATGPYICNNIQYSSNFFVHVPEGIEINGNGTNQTGQYILIRNNLLEDVNGLTYAAPGTTGLGVWFTMGNCGYCTVDHNTSLNWPVGYDIWQTSMGGTNPYLTWTNNIGYGEIASPPVYGGGAVQAILASGGSVGGDINVGDTWPTSYVGGPSQQPLYPNGITTVDATLQPPNQPPCNYGAYWPAPGVEVEKSAQGGCLPLDWTGVGLVDFPGANAGTNPQGAMLSPDSPFRMQSTTGYVDPGAEVVMVLWGVAHNPTLPTQ